MKRLGLLTMAIALALCVVGCGGKEPTTIVTDKRELPPPPIGSTGGGPQKKDKDKSGQPVGKAD
jgi:hypothetical protein